LDETKKAAYENNVNSTKNKLKDVTKEIKDRVKEAKKSSNVNIVRLAESFEELLRVLK